MTSGARYDSRGSNATMYPAPALPWPAVKALPARVALDRALVTAGSVPCMVVEPDAWTSEDPADREIAALYCLDCPVLSACWAAGLTEPHGVWGGKDRTPRSYKRNGEPDA